MSQWDRLHPELGDQEGILSLCRLLDEQAAGWEHRQRLVQRVSAELPAPGQWEGSAANALHRATAELDPVAGFPVMACRQAAQGLRGYAARLGELELEAIKIRAMTAEYEGLRAQLAMKRQAAVEAGDADVSGTGLASSVLNALDGQAEVLAAQIRTGWDELSAQRSTADATLSRVLVAARTVLNYRPSPLMGSMAVFAQPPASVRLSDVSGMSADQLRLWLGSQAAANQFRDLLRQLGQDPVKTAQWWKSLGQSVDAKTGKVTLGPAQQLLTDIFPDIIGNLQGVSYTGRDRANKTFLAYRINELKKLLAGVPSENRDQKLVDELQQLTNAQAALYNQGPDGRLIPKVPLRQLISLNTSLPGTAISVGDLDAAQYTTYMVPGINTTVAKDTTTLSNTAQTQYKEQIQAAGQLPHQIAGSNPRVAVVAWLAFQPADTAGVFSDGNAVQGGEYLSKDLQALKAVQNSLDNGDARNNISALSYGCLTSMLAAKNGMPVDSLTLHGDIGVPYGVSTVKNFQLNPGATVYRTSFSGDLTAEFGHGFRNPTDSGITVVPGGSYIEGFGAITIGSDGVPGEAATTTHAWTTGDPSNPGYADRNTESSINQALTSLGQTDKLTNSGKPIGSR